MTEKENDKIILRICKRGAIYLPKKIMKKLQLEEGDKLLVSIENNKLILEPIWDPLELALRLKKISKVTVEEFEQESEKMQRRLYD